MKNRNNKKNKKIYFSQICLTIMIFNLFLFYNNNYYIHIDGNYILLNPNIYGLRIFFLRFIVYRSFIF